MSRLLGLAFFLCFAGASCRADSFQAFSFNATLTDAGVSSGTLTLDTTTGLFTGVNVSTAFSTPRPPFPPSYLFSMINSQGDLASGSSDDPYREYFGLDLESSPNEPYTLLLLFPSASLVGYGGGSVCSKASDCLFSLDNSAFYVAGNFGYYANTFEPVLAGTLTPISSVPPAVTPEPSSLWLLGTGLVGVGLVVRKPWEVRLRCVEWRRAPLLW